ncbi:MAG: hypothetical protein JXR51_02430 [Bacteroidales bacterium]|nr:hypothetical protein [Bacteroidales bacterium]
MKGTKDNIINDNSYLLRVGISEIEKKKAKEIAKAQGYTFQGWLGQLVKKELDQYSNNSSITSS